jgi:lipoic acid synthetase
MQDIINQKVDILTIGQYLQPSKKHLPVYEYIHPKIFDFYKEEGLKMGFRHVESGALVRSSYRAHKHLK